MAIMYENYENLTTDKVAEYLKSWNSFWAGEWPLGFGEFTTRAYYTARVALSHDEIALLRPEETAEGAKEIEADFRGGDAAWVTQDDWYNQYIDEACAFPWEIENSPEFQEVCASIVAQIRDMRPAPPLPPLDVEKHGLEISDDSIRAAVEDSQKLGRFVSNDGWRDVSRTAYLCYNGKAVWLTSRNPRNIDAWMHRVSGPLTAQEVCNLALAASTPFTGWPKPW